MYDYGYAELAAAIVKQAVDDWRHICRTGTDLSSDTKRHPLQYASTYASFGKLQAFFQSDWCEMLCGDNARNKVFNALQAERSDEMQEQAIIRLDAERMKAALKQPSGRNSIPYEHNGEWHTVKEWAQISGINRRALYTRIARGMTMTEAITGVQAEDEDDT